MTQRPDTNDYRTLFLNDTPIMDMRAPAEFSQGAFPNAQSLPLMTDEERAEVGVCYKKLGQEASIELCHTLVSGSSRDRRMGQWCEFVRAHP
jgi:tRNA 2-selenouridine synthase